MGKYLEIAKSAGYEINEVNERSPAELKIRAWLAHIRETDPELIQEVIDKCRTDPGAMEYFLSRSEEAVLKGPIPPFEFAPEDSRVTCRTCARFRDRKCGIDGARTHPDRPRNCEHYRC